MSTASIVTLEGKVALVTGGTKGVGKGIVASLAEAGARVYYTGRSAAETTAFGIRCDHTDDKQTNSVFERIRSNEGRLDVLVNSAWGGYERMVEEGRFSWLDPFWEQPAWRWGAMFDAGVRAAFVASQHAARLMLEQGDGLIVHLSYWAAQKRLGNAIYGAAKAATDKLASDMAEELQDHKIAVVSLYPGLVRTEAVLKFAGDLDLSNSESPQFAGRAVAAMAADPDVIELTGQTLVAASLARRYGFTDIDGGLPDALTLQSA